MDPFGEVGRVVVERGEMAGLAKDGFYLNFKSLGDCSAACWAWIAIIADDIAYSCSA